MKQPILTKNFCLLFVAQFSTAMVMYMLMTIITEYAESFGATMTLAGMVSGMYIVGALSSRIFAGQIMERAGWKKAGIIFLVLHLVACGGYFFAEDIFTLLAIRFIHGLGFGIASNAFTTIGMSILPRDRYAEAAGYFMLAPTLAIGAGPYIGGIVYNFGANGCFAMASFFSALPLLCLILTDLEGVDPRGRKGEAKAPRPRGLDAFFETKAIPTALCILLLGLGYVGVMSFCRLYAVETGLTGVFSLFFPLYGCILLISRPLAGRIQDKYGDDFVCITGIVMQGIGLLAMALWPNDGTVLLCALGCGLGFGTLCACFNTIICRMTPTVRRAYAVTTFMFFCDAGIGFGPIVLGSLVTHVGYTAMYCAAGVASLLALPMYLYACRKVRKAACPSNDCN